MPIHILAPCRGHRLAAMLFVSWLAGIGCFSTPKMDVGMIQCEIPDDCPSGYICKVPAHRCCMPKDLTCGTAALDGSLVDIQESVVDGLAAKTDDRQGQPPDGRLVEDGLDGAQKVREPADVSDAQPDPDVQDAPASPDDTSTTPDGISIAGKDARDAASTDLPLCQSATDGAPCGEGMVCNKSQCVACPTIGSCPLSNPCHKGVWSCSTGTVVCVDSGNVADGTDCGNGNVCHSGACSACVGGGTCPFPGKPCQVGVLTCSAGVASCMESVPGNDGAACDDGSACTQTDKCQNGQCVGANPITCTALDTCHTAGTCNPATGQCSNPTGNEGGSCSDSSTPCLGGKTCRSGVCQGGSTKSCPASDLCHTPGTCDPTSGICSNPAKTCVAKGQCYQVGTCSPSTGECSNPLQPDGYACSDANPCTINDSCTQGTCTHGAAVQCPDNGGPCYPPGQCSPSGVTYTCVYSSTPYSDGTQCQTSSGNWGACSTYPSTGIAVCLLL